MLSLTLAAAALWRKRNDVRSGCIESKQFPASAIVKATLPLLIPDASQWPLCSVEAAEAVLNISPAVYHLLLFTDVFNLGLFFFLRSVICIVVAPYTPHPVVLGTVQNRTQKRHSLPPKSSQFDFREWFVFTGPQGEVQDLTLYIK